MKFKLILTILLMSAMSWSQTKRISIKKKGTRPAKFYYGNVMYTSFADEVIAQAQGQRIKARSIFSGFGVGGDYTIYLRRYIYGWNISLMQGHVDIEEVANISYPRKQFLGVSTGPELGYRLNSDFDISYSAGLMYRQIDTIGQSFVLANQINLKFRLSPKFTFFQNFGNYGKEKSYSYSIGMRWLL